MRVGLNPHKDKPIVSVDYTYQVVIPVYIPHFNDYFKESFQVLKLCLESLFKTVCKKTYITLVNNGSCAIVKEYLDELSLEGKINEVIHTSNIGKINAILKGVVGHSTELVTISDADVLFLPNWQRETIKVFNQLEKVGVVGIVPQFCTFKSKCENIIFENLFSRKLKFLPVKNQEALIRFYDSIGWKRDYNKDYLKYTLGLELNSECKVILGSGHFVSTFRRVALKEIETYLPFKLGGPSEEYIDGLPLDYDLWRVTTYDNYAYHMGNVVEDWMLTIDYENHDKHKENGIQDIKAITNTCKKWFQFRNKIFKYLFMNKTILSFFYKKWGLPSASVKNY
ncbi:glycosyltransferase family 2 protein [Flavobacterium sp.]|uniref:glycosyltransferase family 2 protein n=1 Tax=Flavobacterium sp. TaxID=239 RepID=UPI003D0F3FB0